jgi:hypothetical protein
MPPPRKRTKGAASGWACTATKAPPHGWGADPPPSRSRRSANASNRSASFSEPCITSALGDNPCHAAIIDRSCMKIGSGQFGKRTPSEAARYGRESLSLGRDDHPTGPSAEHVSAPQRARPEVGPPRWHSTALPEARCRSIGVRAERQIRLYVFDGCSRVSTMLFCDHRVGVSECIASPLVCATLPGAKKWLPCRGGQGSFSLYHHLRDDGRRPMRHGALRGRYRTILMPRCPRDLSRLPCCEARPRDRNDTR